MTCTYPPPHMPCMYPPTDINNPLLQAQIADLLKQVHATPGAGAPSAAAEGAPVTTTPAPGASNAGVCVAESKLWGVCMQAQILKRLNAKP